MYIHVNTRITHVYIYIRKNGSNFVYTVHTGNGDHKMEQKEKEIEKRLVNVVKDKGGLCLKLASPGRIGVPDRIILYPNGVVGFAELKRPGAVPRPLQEYWLELLRKLGLPAEAIDSKTAAAEYALRLKMESLRREK